jgi:hypothetical protein
MGTEPIPILQHSEVRFIGICSNSQTSCSFFPCLLVNAMFFDDCTPIFSAGLDSCSNEPQTWFEPLCSYFSLATNHPKVAVTSLKSGRNIMETLSGFNPSPKYTKIHFCNIIRNMLRNKNGVGQNLWAYQFWWVKNIQHQLWLEVRATRPWPDYGSRYCSSLRNCSTQIVPGTP